MLSIRPTNPNTIGKEYKFYVNGLSVNTYTGRSLSCVWNVAFTVVKIDSMALWKTGL